MSAGSLGASALQPGEREGSGLLGSGESCAQSGFLRDNKPQLMKEVTQIETWEIVGLVGGKRCWGGNAALTRCVVSVVSCGEV